MRLSNKIAAITGAGNGIGRAAAELFADEGAYVFLLDLDESAGRGLEEHLREKGGTARFIKVDVSDYGMVRDAFAAMEKEQGGLHILYNNASIFLGGRDAPVSELDTEVWDKIISVNLSGSFYCCKCAVPLIVKSGGGSVINTSSSAGLIGIPGCDAYTATKGAAISMTRSMAVEYGPSGVRVNCIAPAAVLTDMVKESNFKDKTFDEQLFLKTTPVRRWGEPVEIARVALFLASDESSYLNGAIIAADGGITIT